MKKIFCILIGLILAFSSFGCTNEKTLQKTKIITACTVSGDENSKYTFYAVASGGASEEGNSKISLNSYTFFADNFSDATEQLEKSLGFTDLSHMSIFLADKGYISNKFIFDSPYIKQKIKINPLVKVFISSQSQNDIIESINTNNNSIIENYYSTAFVGKRNKILCTMTELFFASANPLYTASIPLVSAANENTLPVVESIAFYNSDLGVCMLDRADFPTYEKAIMTFGKTSKIFNLNYKNNELFATIKKDYKDNKKVCSLAQKYQGMGFDIFNSVYFAKKCFPTYSQYLKSIENILPSDINFK